MKAGDSVEITQDIEGSKKNIYAVAGDLVTIISTNHLPVLLVHLFGKPEKTFSVRIEKVTTELNLKNKVLIKNVARI